MTNLSNECLLSPDGLSLIMFQYMEGYSNTIAHESCNSIN